MSEVARRTRLHALTRTGTGHQTSVQSTASMPLSHAPAHTVVPQSEWDLCPRALQVGRCCVAAGFAPLALLKFLGGLNPSLEAVTRSA
jgi:hypothetical protein